MYVDKSANMDMAQRIVLDAKVDYPAACNAMVIINYLQFLLITSFLIYSSIVLRHSSSLDLSLSLCFVHS